MDGYKQVLNRLVQFRKSMTLTQQQMAEKLGITQEQYSCFENGREKITADILQKLEEMGLDINLFILGRNASQTVSELSVMYERVKNTEYGKDINRIASYILGIISLSGSKMETGNIQLLRYLSQHWDDFSMILFVREQHGYSQMVMADVLGVGIKKYRKLEKEIIYPDAELLYRLCEKGKYQPVLFLDSCDRKLYIMELIWNEIDSEKKKKAKNVFHDLYCLLPE